jgi:hypothetical protein
LKIRLVLAFTLAPALALAPALLPGCGYTLAGRGSFLPAAIKTIGIPPFDSLVPRGGLAERFTAAVTREFVGRGGYRITTGREGADALLSGTITGYITTPITFDVDGRATRMSITVTASVTLVQLGDGKVLYENRAFQFRSEEELSEDPETYYDPESEAVQEIARSFSHSLVATIVEGF